MGVLAPRSAHARHSARPPIDASGNFPAHVSAESLSNTSANPWEVISEVSKVYDKLLIFEIYRLSGHTRVNRVGSVGAAQFIFDRILPINVTWKLMQKFRSLSRLYLILTHFPVKIWLSWGGRGVPEFFLWLESFDLCYMGAHAIICNFMISLSGIYSKIAQFLVHKNINWGGMGGYKNIFFIGIFILLLFRSPFKI